MQLLTLGFRRTTSTLPPLSLMEQVARAASRNTFGSRLITAAQFCKNCFTGRLFCRPAWQIVSVMTGFVTAPLTAYSTAPQNTNTQSIATWNMGASQSHLYTLKSRDQSGKEAAGADTLMSD